MKVGIGRQGDQFLLQNALRLGATGRVRRADGSHVGSRVKQEVGVLYGLDPTPKTMMQQARQNLGERAEVVPLVCRQVVGAHGEDVLLPERNEMLATHTCASTLLEDRHNTSGRPDGLAQIRYRYLQSESQHQEEDLMGFNPRDAIDSVQDIATNALEKSGDIVESAGHIIKGDVSGGVEGIVASSMDIATHSAGKAKEIVTGRTDASEEDEANL